MVLVLVRQGEKGRDCGDGDPGGEAGGSSGFPLSMATTAKQRRPEHSGGSKDEKCKKKNFV